MRNISYIYFALNTCIGLVIQVALVEVQAFAWYVVFFPYLLPILWLPMLAPATLCMLLAFLLGLGADLLYDTMGVQATGALTVAFIRQLWINFSTAPSIQEVQVYPRAAYLGWAWYLVYIGPLLLVHHVLVFSLEMGVLLLQINSMFVLVQGWLLSVVFFILAEMVAGMVRQVRNY